MKENISGIIALLASFQLLFVSIFLFTHKKGKQTNNRLLGLIFLLFALSLVDFSLRISGIQFRLQVLHLIDDGFFFLYGPLIYFYVRRVVYRDLRWKAKHLFHLIPYLSYCLYLILALVVLNPEEQSQLTQKIINASLPAWVYLIGLSVYVYTLAYLWLAYRTVNTYRRVIRNKFSSLEKINLTWLEFILQSFVAITVVAMIHNVVPALGNFIIIYASLILLLIFTFYFINRVLVKALKQPEIFSGIQLQEGREKYTGSRLTDEESEHYFSQLQSILENDKLYLNPDLTLQVLADRLQISSKILSQVINQRSGRNFFDYINSYRCKQAKNLMRTSDPKMTILEILYESGFNSKSSFNKEFKKLNGTTPSEYRKSIGSF